MPLTLVRARRPIRGALRTLHCLPPLRSTLLPPHPHRAELDARRHNRWYSTTGCRSARIWCRSTFISLNFTGTVSVTGVRGFSEGKLDFDSHWILRLEARFGVKVSCDVSRIALRFRTQSRMRKKSNHCSHFNAASLLYLTI